MANRRPRKTTVGLTAREQALLRARWRSWMDRILDDLGDLLLKKQLFLELAEMIDAAPHARDPGAFLNWLVDNYVTAIAVGVRRATDTDHRSHSLGRFLYEAIQNPQVLTRAAHQRLYRRLPWAADKTFDKIAGTGYKFLTARTVSRRSETPRTRRGKNSSLREQESGAPRATWCHPEDADV